MKITIESEQPIQTLSITFEPTPEPKVDIAAITRDVEAITNSINMNMQQNSQEDFQSQTEERFT